MSLINSGSFPSPLDGLQRTTAVQEPPVLISGDSASVSPQRLETQQQLLQPHTALAIIVERVKTLPGGPASLIVASIFIGLGSLAVSWLCASGEVDDAKGSPSRLPLEDNEDGFGDDDEGSATDCEINKWLRGSYSLQRNAWGKVSVKPKPGVRSFAVPDHVGSRTLRPEERAMISGSGAGKWRGYAGAIRNTPARKFG